jgi:preprotein translocase subunit SecF
MFIVNHRKLFFTLSGLLVAGSIVAMFALGFFKGKDLSIDFTGGSLLEVSFINRPDINTVKAELDTQNLGDYTLTPTGSNDYIVKTRELSPAEKTSVESAMSTDPTNPATEVSFDSIGPSVGAQLETKAFEAIAVVILCIVLFITFAFRKVSHPVASWKYGFATIVALAHDVIIPTGVFLVWSHFHGGQVDLLFVTALLAILGYSVHDTIVVFDRVRENLRLDNASKSKTTFAETVGTSVTQTFGRSINTSFTIFLALVALYFIGGTTTKDFAFVLLIGVITGTYSSIFVASPLLVSLQKGK